MFLNTAKNSKYPSKYLGFVFVRRLAVLEINNPLKSWCEVREIGEGAECTNLYGYTVRTVCRVVVQPSCP